MRIDLSSFEVELDKILGPELAKLIDDINASPGSSTSPFVHLPTATDVDLGPDEVRSLIARTSNQYGNACRLAGIARARFKLAEAAYKYKYRTSMGDGRNVAEREAQAMAAAHDEYQQMVLLEATVELAESIESACRIASESSRRILMAVDNMQKAENRGLNYGSFKESDFSTF